MVPVMPINALVLTTSLAAAAASTPADSLLRSGPMVGYSEMREVLLWVQTKRPARVRFAYWEEDNPAARRLTRETTTVAERGLRGEAPGGRGRPGASLRFELILDGKRVLRPYPLRFQTLPQRGRGEPARDFRVALGSCFWVNDPETDSPGSRPGADPHVFQSIAAARARPDALARRQRLHARGRLGLAHRDALSLQPDARRCRSFRPCSAAPITMRSGTTTTTGRTTRTAPFEASTSHGRSSTCSGGTPASASTRARGSPPASRGATRSSSCWTIGGTVHRTTASPDGGRSSASRRSSGCSTPWRRSGATFKIVAVGGQVLNPGSDRGDLGDRAGRSRRELLRRITDERVRGVLFVSGDRHFTELSGWSALGPTRSTTSRSRR